MHPPRPGAGGAWGEVTPTEAPAQHGGHLSAAKERGFGGATKRPPRAHSGTAELRDAPGASARAGPWVPPCLTCSLVPPPLHWAGVTQALFVLWEVCVCVHTSVRVGRAPEHGAEWGRHVSQGCGTAQTFILQTDLGS